MAEQLKWDHFQETLMTSLGLEKEEVSENTHLYNDIGIDSLGMFSLGMKLMKIYDIKLPLSSVATIQTIGELYSAMEDTTKTE